MPPAAQGSALRTRKGRSPLDPAHFVRQLKIIAGFEESRGTLSVSKSSSGRRRQLPYKIRSYFFFAFGVGDGVFGVVDAL